MLIPSLSSVQVRRINRFRIPVEGSHPEYWYIVSLDRESRMPSVDELIALRSYQTYAVVSLYREHYARRILAKPFPAEYHHVTAIFKKIGPARWLYRRCTWTEGPLYMPVDGNYRPIGKPLVEIFDKLTDLGSSPYPKWLRWKQEHPTDFAALQ